MADGNTSTQLVTIEKATALATFTIDGAIDPLLARIRQEIDAILMPAQLAGARIHVRQQFGKSGQIAFGLAQLALGFLAADVEARNAGCLFEQQAASLNGRYRGACAVVDLCARPLQDEQK